MQLPGAPPCLAPSISHISPSWCGLPCLPTLIFFLHLQPLSYSFLLPSSPELRGLYLPEGQFPLELHGRTGKSFGTGIPLCLSQSSRPRSPACASAWEAYRAVGRKHEGGRRIWWSFCLQPSSPLSSALAPSTTCTEPPV